MPWTAVIFFLRFLWLGLEKDSERRGWDWGSRTLLKCYFSKLISPWKFCHFENAWTYESIVENSWNFKPRFGPRLYRDCNEGANFHSAIQVKLRIFFSVMGKIRNFKGNHIEASQFICAENELIDFYMISYNTQLLMRRNKNYPYLDLFYMIFTNYPPFQYYR